MKQRICYTYELITFTWTNFIDKWKTNSKNKLFKFYVQRSSQLRLQSKLYDVNFCLMYSPQKNETYIYSYFCYLYIS